MKLYLIPGLASDKRIFSKLSIDTETEVLEFHERQREDETLAEYVKGFADRINTNEEFAVLGLSLGGIMLTELHKILKPAKSVFLSTMLHQSERPDYFGLFEDRKGIYETAFRNMDAFLNLLDLPIPFVDKEDRTLIREMGQSADKAFVIWAVEQVLSWRNDTWPHDYLRLHGTWDLVFPGKKIKDSEWIERGTHGMVLGRAAELSQMITAYLRQ